MLNSFASSSIVLYLMKLSKIKADVFRFGAQATEVEHLIQCV